MPLLFWENSPPTIAQLGKTNPFLILNERHALKSDIRSLRIGLMNNMTDEALRATERQFLRLIGAEPVLQIEPVLFTAKWVERSLDTQSYIDKHYKPFSRIQEEGLDALIISGTNYGDGSIDGLPFWWEFVEVMNWAQTSVVSTLTSCLATHAVMKYKFNVDRTLNIKDSERQKIWWVYPHTKEGNTHPLVSCMNDDILVPHSRWNGISRKQFEDTGHQVLIAWEESGVHLAVNPDFKWVMMQGHPEYDTASIAREFLRDKREGKTHVPYNYITTGLTSMDVDISKWYSNEEIEIFWELKNNWRDSAQIMFARWIWLVYKLTHFEKPGQYMDNIDPKDPLWSLMRQN